MNGTVVTLNGNCGNNLSMNRVLVTGSSGYLGGRICNFLEEKGFKITKVSFLKKKKKNNDNINYISSVYDESLIELCKKNDHIIHLAGPDFLDCKKNKKKSYKDRVELSHHLYVTAIKARINSFIYFSTLHVYDGNFDKLINEKTKPIPLDNYSKFHVDVENRIIQNKNSNKINFYILRLSNAIGFPISKETKSWHLVGNDFVKQAILNKKIKIKSSPFISRDFIPIISICIFVIYLLKSRIKSKIININSETNISLLDLANLIIEKVNKKINRKIMLVVNKNEKDINTDNKRIIKSNKYFMKKLRYKKELNFEINNLVDLAYKWFRNYENLS